MAKISKNISQITTLSRLTALEAMRLPVCLLVTTTAVLMAGLLPWLVTHAMGEAGKIIRDSVFATHFLFGLLLSCYTAGSTLDQEIRRGTVATILCKPVDRAIFFFSKFFGVALVIIIFGAMMTMATLLAERAAQEPFHTDWWSSGPLLITPLLAFIIGGFINFKTRRAFTSNAFILLFIGICIAFVFTGFVDREGHLQNFGAHFSYRMLPASILITMAVLVIQALALALSSRIATGPTLSICGALFLGGLMSDYLFGRVAETNALAAFFYRVVPNWQHFWVIDGLNGGGTIPWAYLGHTGLYGLLYIIALLFIGLAAFSNNEIS